MKHSLAHNAAYNVVYQLLNVIFPLISAGYVSRVLTPEGVGRVAYAQNIVSYFVMAAALGIPAYGTREIARYRDDPRKRSRVFSELLVIGGFATTLCLAAYGFSVRTLFPADRGLYAAAGLELVFCYIGIDWFFQGTEEYGYITRRNLLVKALSLAALFLFVKDRGDYILYAVIHSLGIGCNNLFNLLHVRKQAVLTFSGLNLKQHSKPILWLMAGAVTASLYNKVDITMLGAMTAAEAVAYYSNAHKTVSIVLALVTAVSAVFLPRLSYLYIHDRPHFCQCVSDGVHAVVLLAVPACAGVMLVADNLMLCLFGEAFRPAAGVLRVLAVFTIVKGVGDLLCYQAIISSGKERYLFKTRLAAGLVNVLLNGFLIPAYAQNGAAAASVISELIVNGMMLIPALRLTKVRLEKSFCLSVALSTAVMVPVAWWLQGLPGQGAAGLAAAVCGGLLCYGLMLVITKNRWLRNILAKKRESNPANQTNC